MAAEQPTDQGIEEGSRERLVCECHEYNITGIEKADIGVFPDGLVSVGVDPD